MTKIKKTYENKRYKKINIKSNMFTKIKINRSFNFVFSRIKRRNGFLSQISIYHGHLYKSGIYEQSMVKMRKNEQESI